MAQQPPAGGPMTTIVPFNDIQKLPACAAACGPLYDANGGCVPPAVAPANADSYAACFCANSKVAPFSTGTAGVCDTACTADPKGLASIQGWFTSLCNVKNAGGAKTNTAPTKTGTSTNKQTGTGVPDFSTPQGDGGSWLSNHWQWVIMIVILVVGIAALWVGACIWRRRYLRKKDRQTSLGQKHSGTARNPSWGPTITGSDSAAPMNFAAGHDAERGAVSEKPRKSKQKKKWTVSERT